MLDGNHFFECRCGSYEHTLRFVINKTDKEIYTSIFLNQWRSWWKRAWVAVRYLFGYKCTYGEWDHWALCLNDVERLRDMCNDFIADISEPNYKERSDE